MLNLPEWDLGPEDAMQIDLLPNVPPSGGYENIITAMDVFSRYLFVYPVTDASATNTAKVIDETYLLAYYFDHGQRNGLYVQIGSQNCTNFGNSNMMCNYKTSTNNW